MSGITALIVIVALVMVNFFLVVYMGTWVSNLSEGIASGGFQGFPISVKHRRYLLQSRFVLNAGTTIMAFVLLAIGWVFIGLNAGTDDLKLLAYLTAFLNGGGAIGWPITLPSHYRHLAAEIRDSEQR